MDFSFFTSKKVKSFSEKTKSLILAYWIRKWERNLNSNNKFQNRWISDFNKMILNYAKMYEEWDPNACGDDIKITKNKIEKVSKKWGYSSVFGKTIFSEGKHHWIFKLGHMNKWNYFNCAMGICLSRKVMNKINTYFPGYGFYPNYGHTRNKNNSELMIDHEDGIHNYDGNEYGPKCNKGDIIEMIVDMNELSMKFIINNKDYGYGYKPGEIPKGEYRMGVRLVDQNCWLEMLES